MAAKFASHDPKIISVFEVIGSYYVDVVYNHIYSGARSNVASGSSVTDDYLRRVQAFVTGIKNDERCYGDVVQEVHRYFISQTRYTALSFGDFVDRIVGACVPEDYFRQFTAGDKDELLSSILCDLVSNLAAVVSRPDMLRRIIDEHGVTPEVTIRMLQDSAVNTLIAKRGALCNKFMKKMGQAREHVSMDVLDDMKLALRRLAKEKAEAVARAESAEGKLADARERTQKARTREAKLLKAIDLLRAGRKHGAAAAGAALAQGRAPPRDTLAEDPLDPDRPARPPRRERIAERHRDRDAASEDEDDASDASDEADEAEEDEEDEGASRRGKKKPAKGTKPAGNGRLRPTVPSNFFTTGGPGPAAPAAGARASPATGGGRPAGGPSAALTSLLDEVVDVDAPDADRGTLAFGDAD